MAKSASQMQLLELLRAAFILGESSHCITSAHSKLRGYFEGHILEDTWNLNKQTKKPKYQF